MSTHTTNGCLFTQQNHTFTCRGLGAVDASARTDWISTRVSRCPGLGAVGAVVRRDWVSASLICPQDSVGTRNMRCRLFVLWKILLPHYLNMFWRFDECVGCVLQQKKDDDHNTSNSRWSGRHANYKLKLIYPTCDQFDPSLNIKQKSKQLSLMTCFNGATWAIINTLRHKTWQIKLPITFTPWQYPLSNSNGLKMAFIHNSKWQWQ